VNEFYNDIKTVATTLINKYGAKATFEIRTPSGDEWDPTIAITFFDAVGVLSNFSDMPRTESLIEDTLIKKSDRVLTVISDVEPVESSHVIFGGIEYVVVGVVPCAPAGENLLYDVYIKA